MTEPSPFFRQHHAVEAPAIDDATFRPYWRLRPRLDQLLLDRAISITEWRAATLFRGDAERVAARRWRTSSTDRASGGGDLAIAIGLTRYLDAAARLNEINRAIGAWAFDLLEAHIVDDLSWRLLGERYGVHSKTARSWTILSLRALAMVIGGKP